MGFPSVEEQKIGVPFHGEATSVEWDVLAHSTKPNGNQHVTMKCSLPIARMTLVREYQLFDNSSVCRITDTVTNNNSFRKPFNMMQHPTVGPAFLTETVRADCNAATGFLNTRDPESMPGTLFSWPQVEIEQTPVDLRYYTDQKNACFNYTISTNTPNGWGTICNASQGLLIGTLWSTAEYPWLRVWRNWNKGNPAALSIELSTTPFGIALDEIIQKGDVLNTPTIAHLDPSESVTKTFYTFLTEIPENFNGVEQVVLEQDQLLIREAKTDRTIQLPIQARR